MVYSNSCYVSQLTRNTLSLILAGRKGSRLCELTQNKAKPVIDIEALGLLLAIYLLLDAFNSFALANAIHPPKGWVWMIFNGVTSLLLATLFLLGWPSTSLYLVGLYVGIGLLFDGWILFAIGWALRKG
jgi:uncharacterized membrane protein HdeD (DUF308 family)